MKVASEVNGITIYGMLDRQIGTIQLLQYVPTSHLHSTVNVLMSSGYMLLKAKSNCHNYRDNKEMHEGSRVL